MNAKKSVLKYCYFIGVFLITTGCNSPEVKEFGQNSFVFLQDYCMLVNQEQNNTIEGNYFLVDEVLDNNIVRVNIPKGFYLNSNEKLRNWMIGWGSNENYYDAGNENLRAIVSLDISKGIIELGEVLRGKISLPQKGSRIVFWNRNPSGYKMLSDTPVIDAEMWKSFAGTSVEFGTILYDNKTKKWWMFAQEVDNDTVQIHLASSSNLRFWKAENNGLPVLTFKDFEHTNWAGYGTNGLRQSAKIYSSVFHNGVWYLIMSGHNKEGKRSIGIGSVKDFIGGKIDIDSFPIINHGNKGDWDETACFYPKILRLKSSFLLCYDGVNADGKECVGVAFSDDLKTWKKSIYNPVIEAHTGWRSGVYTSEPNFIFKKGDTTFISCGGYKKFNHDFTEHEEVNGYTPFNFNINRGKESERGKHLSGNVMDAHLGLYFTTDSFIKNFQPHPHNPVFTNDYANKWQNDHLGGNFFHTIVNDTSFIIYQAKSEYNKSYNIMARFKPL